MKEIYVISIEGKNKGNDKVILINKESPFKRYTFFKILDDENSNPICKVSISYSCRNLKDIDNMAIYKNAVSCGFKDNEVFYYAEVEIEKELLTSISPTAMAIPATEKEMYNYLYTKSDDNLVLGEIRGTEDNYKNLKLNTYKNRLLMCDDWKLTPQVNLPLLFDYKKLQQNPNIGIFGNSGSGKTFTLKTLVEEFINHNIPTILFDPHNEFDFSDYMDSLPKEFKFNYSDRVEVFEAGKDFGIRFTDLSNESFKNFIRNVSTLSDPQELALDELRVSKAESFESFRIRVEDVATALIKKDAKDKELTAQEKMYIAQYGSKIASPTVVSALSGKLSSFSKRGFFNKDYDNLVIALKNKKTIIIRGEYDIVAPMMGHIINSLWRKRKEFKDSLSKEEYPPMVVVLDESHIFAPKFSNDNKTPLKKPLQDISREGRKYGMFLVCATQRISELDSTILSQMSTKIVLKTAQEADKQIVQKECGLSEAENNRLHLLDSGHGYIISPILKTKSAIAFKSRSNYTKPKTTVNVFDELEIMKVSDSEDTFRDYLLKQIPLKMVDFNKISSNYAAFSGTIKSVNDIKKELSKLVSEGILKEEGALCSKEYVLVKGNLSGTVFEYKGYNASVNFDCSDEIFIGEVLDIKDYLTFHGKTIEETEKMFHQSIDNYIDLLEKINDSSENEFN